jgi:hypothetical protein
LTKPVAHYSTQLCNWSPAEASSGRPSPLSIGGAVEQRLSLAVSRLGLRDSTEQRVATGVLGAGEVDGLDEEDSEDDKSKDPLQGNDLDCHLLHSQSCKESVSGYLAPYKAGQLTKSQESETVAQEVILGRHDVGRAEGEDQPDEDIGDNPRGEAIAVDCDSSIPEECHQSPGVGTCDRRKMYERR